MNEVTIDIIKKMQYYYRPGTPYCYEPSHQKKRAVDKKKKRKRKLKYASKRRNKA